MANSGFGSGVRIPRANAGHAHIVVYTKNAEADRAFFHEFLGFESWMLLMAGLCPATTRGRFLSIR